MRWTFLPRVFLKAIERIIVTPREGVPRQARSRFQQIDARGGQRRVDARNAHECRTDVEDAPLHIVGGDAVSEGAIG